MKYIIEVYHEILDNVLFSDHCICVLNTNLESKNTNEINVNYYTSDIPCYNLMEASEEDWKNLIEILMLLINFRVTHRDFGIGVDQ